MSDVESLPALVMDAHQRLATKYLFIGFFALFLYDMALTMPAEAKYIWKRKFSVVTFVYFMNRYYALAVACVTCAALFSPLFTPQHFAIYAPYALGIVMTILPEIIMAFRVSALYNRNRFIDLSLVVYIVAEFITIMIIYTRPGHQPLPIPDGVHGEPFQECVDELPASLGTLKPAVFQIMATVYDTAVFLAVMYKTMEGLRRYAKDGTHSMVGLMGAHSLVYFAVILSSNFLWALLILFAPVGLKYSTVFATVLLVSAVINRMTLDLRAFSRTGGWFAAERATFAVLDSSPSGANTNDSRNKRSNPEPVFTADDDDNVDYVLSELTLTRTLRTEGEFDVDIELRSPREVWGRPKTPLDKIHVDVDIQFA